MIEKNNRSGSGEQYVSPLLILTCNGGDQLIKSVGGINPLTIRSTYMVSYDGKLPLFVNSYSVHNVFYDLLYRVFVCAKKNRVPST